MEYDPQKIIGKFSDSAKTAVHDLHSDWWQQYDYNTNRLKSILNSLKIDLARSDTWKNDPERFWNDMQMLNSRLYQWVKSLHIIEPNISLEQFTTSFNKSFEQIIAQFPTEIRIMLGDFYWQVQPNDRFRVKLKKRLRPFQSKLVKLALLINNGFRDLRQKPPLKNMDEERIIALHQFLHMYLALPVHQFIKDEWSRYLQTFLGQYFVVYAKLTDILQAMLLAENSEEILNTEQENIFSTLYMMAETLKEIDISLESVKEYQKQMDQRFDKFWTEMQDDLLWAWDRAGTFQLAEKKYSNEAFLAKQYRMDNRFKRDIYWWQLQIRGLTGEWIRNLSIIQLGLSTSLTMLHAARIVRTGISDKILPEFDSTQQQIEQIIHNTENMANARALTEYYEQFLTEFSRTRFSHILDTISAAQIPGTVEQAIAKIELFTDNMTPDVDIFVQRDTTNLPPHSKVRKVGLKNIVEFSAIKPCAQLCANLVDTMSGKQDDIYRNISQLGRMIEFQFETAVQLVSENDLGERLDEAKLIIRDTMIKAKQQVALIISEINEISTLVKEQLPARLTDFCTKQIYMFSSDNIIQENIYLAKQQSKHKRGVIVQNIYGIISKLGYFLITKPWKYVIYILKTYFLQIPVADQTPDVEPIQLGVSQFLEETTEKIAQLPYIYRKLFLFSPLPSFRFYAARETEFSALRDEYNRWQNGKKGMVALIGELGSGKTTLLNIAKNEIFNAENTYHIDCAVTVRDEKELAQFLSDQLKAKKANKLSSLFQTLSTRPKGEICIIENLNVLFPKTISGMSLMELLLGYMVQTQSHIFWMVSCSAFSWFYLKKTIKLEHYFQRVINLGEFSNGDIKTIIMNRHRLSGYGLHFESNGNLDHTKKLKKLRTEDHRQEYLNRQYFHKLNEISAGNVSVAMLYWLRSIHAIQDDRVVINASIEFNYNFLNDLSNLETFTLASIINFDSISVADHADLFKQSTEQSELQLNQMLRYGILIKENDKYIIHPFLYRHLVELLKSKNILY